jgi:glycosyltransferase involved in cell wall biosynthesis
LIRLREKGVRTIEVPIERRISVFRDLKSLMRMISVLRKEKPFMVHSMTPKAGMLCMLAAWIARVPRRVHTFTGLVWPTSTGLKRKILMATDWLTCACATHIIPEGKGVMNDLQSHITNKPMKVLGYGNVRGVDMEKFSRRTEVEEMAKGIKKEGIFTFIFVGRIVGDKGINELVSAFAELHKKYENTRLLLVGRFED